jgi:hypothetical protein
MPRPRKNKPTVRSVKQHVRQSNRQTVVVNLGNQGRKRRPPPLRSSNKSLDVKHVHYYNTPTQSPLFREDESAVRQMRMEINELKAERDKNNVKNAETVKNASSFTQTNPLTEVIKPISIPEVIKPVPIPEVMKVVKKVQPSVKKNILTQNNDRTT